MIYFCIPCHNEERTVGIVLWKIRQVMADFPRDYQILVADDASTDKSYDVLEPYSRVLPLTLLRQSERRGYAATLEMLLREAVRRSAYPKRDIVVVLQADFTDDPEFAVALLKRLESGADIAVPDPVASAEPGLMRGLATRFARQFAMRREWPPEVKDPLHGFIAIRLFCAQKAFDAQPGRLLAWEGRAANAALLHAVLPHARRVDAVEITSHPNRLQRNSRFAAIASVRNAWRFGRGAQTAGILDVEQLAPDQVHGDRAALRTSTPNGTRDSAGKREGPASRPRRSGEPVGRGDRSSRTSGDRSRGAPQEARAGQAGPRQGEGSNRQRRAPAASQTASPAEAGAGTAPRDKPRGGGRSRSQTPRRGRPEKRPDNASEMSPVRDEIEGTAPPEAGVETAPEESADAKKRRPRGSRGRRGGRKRSARPTPAGELGQAPQGSNSEALTAPEAESEGTGTEDGADAATNGEGAARKRRRRGRRGGRRHKASRTPRDGTLGAPDGAPVAGSDPAPAVAGPTGPPDE